MPFVTQKRRAVEGDVVEFAVNVPQQNLKPGRRGIVVSTFDEPEAYDFEIIGEDENFIGFAYSVKPDQFLNLSRNAFVRAMEAVERLDLTMAERELKLAIELRPEYIGVFVMSVLNSVPDPVEHKGFDEDVNLLIPLLRLATRVDPTYEFARFNLAIAFLNFGVGKAKKREYGAAIECFYAALSIRTDQETEEVIKTNLVVALTSLAREALSADKVEEGFGLVRTAYSVMQDATTQRNLGLAHGNLGILYMRNQRFDYAIEQFERAEDAGVVLAEFLNDYGLCLLFTERIGGAIRMFERVLEIQPDNENAKHNLGKLERLSNREGIDLKSFENRLVTPKENLADLDRRIPRNLAWRRPSVAPQDFTFA